MGWVSVILLPLCPLTEREERDLEFYIEQGSRCLHTGLRRG